MGEETKKTEETKNEDQKVEQKKTEEKVEQPVVDVDAKVQAKFDAERRKDDEKKAHDSLGYLRRTNPEAYKKLMGQFGGEGGSAELSEANKRIEKLELDRTREKVMRTYKLDDDDEMFLTSTTAEGIESQAKTLREKLDKAAGAKKSGDSDDDDRGGDPQNKNKTDLPDHQGKPRDPVELAKQQLVELAQQKTR